MRNKLVFKYLGKVIKVFSILLLVPVFISLIYKEHITPFIIPFFISFILGMLLDSIKVKNTTMYSKDGFSIVALSWILISIIGAIPFMMEVHLSFPDAFFEAVSGFTTTGATIFKDVEVLPQSILFWRSFTHFIGGMGVLTFVMAIIPLSKDDKSMHLLKAEMPGPTVAKLVPSLKKTLFYLYGIYIALTVTEIILLMCGGMNLFHSTLIAFGTAGTGGFTYLNTSLATISLFNKYVVALFMFLFGVNFNIYFLIAIMKDVKTALKSEELRMYIMLYVVSTIFVFLNTYNMFSNISDALSGAVFHVSSFMTSTGYSVGDVNIYPTCCRIVILILMLISACAGSTCGGFKVSRLVICLKTIKRDLLKTIHPNSVRTIKFEGKTLDDETINATSTFLFLYVLLLCITMFLVSFDGYSLEVVINAVFTTFANVGLAFKISNFAAFSSFAKIILSFGMLLGRLELFPLLVLFANIRTKIKY